MLQGERLGKNRRHFLRNIGYCPQFDSIIPELTGRELLNLMCRVSNLFLASVSLSHNHTLVLPHSLTLTLSPLGYIGAVVSSILLFLNFYLSVYVIAGYLKHTLYVTLCIYIIYIINFIALFFSLSMSYSLDLLKAVNAHLYFFVQLLW